MPTMHANRPVYAAEMQSLEREVLEMASRAEQMVELAVRAFTQMDSTEAMRVLGMDNEVDSMDRDIEMRCLRLLALQQPIASELRTVGTILKIVTDLERVGDLAVDIAKAELKIEKEFGESNVVDLPRMGNVARQMLRLALEMFVHRRVELLDEISVLENQVDALYRSLREQVFVAMRQNPDNVVSDAWILLAIHHVERIADHACNIGERVYFMVTGNLREVTGSGDAS